jgi:hypothetical protein
MEHRWGQRFEVDILVRVHSRPYAVRTGRLIDVSMSGGYIVTGMDLRELRRLQIALVLPHRFSHATPMISAYVARRHRDGIGVEWCDFAPQAVVELLRSPAAKPHNRSPYPAAPHDPALMHGT